MGHSIESGKRKDQQLGNDLDQINLKPKLGNQSMYILVGKKPLNEKLEKVSLDKKKQNEPLAQVEGTNDVDKSINLLINDIENATEVRESSDNIDSEFLDATKMDENFYDSQAIVGYDKDNVKDLLEKSWANMAEMDEGETQDDDTSIDDAFKLVNL